MSLSVLQVSEFLGVSRGMVYKLAAPGGPIPCTRIGARVIFDESDVRDYKASCRVEPLKLESVRLRSRSIAPNPLHRGPNLMEVFNSMGITPRTRRD